MMLVLDLAMLAGIFAGIIFLIAGLILWSQLGIKYPVKHPFKFLLVWAFSPLLLVIPLLLPLLEKIPPLRKADRKAIKEARARQKKLDAMSGPELRFYFRKKSWAENFHNFGRNAQQLDPSSKAWKESVAAEKFPTDVNTMINDVVETSVEISWMEDDAADLGDYLIEERRKLHEAFDVLKEILIAHFDFDEEEAEDYLIYQVSYGMTEAEFEYQERNTTTNPRNLAEDYFIPVKAS